MHARRHIMRRFAMSLVASVSLLAVALSAAPAGAAAAVGARTAATQDPSGPKSRGGVQLFEANCVRGAQVFDVGTGDSGTNVREVQCLLNWTLSWNAYPVSIPQTGYYDGVTAGATRTFQTCANNLGAGLRVDGRVGPRTLPHLRWWAEEHYRGRLGPIC
jgi:zinc D-Ala-D-Ala carboxypeptidase